MIEATKARAALLRKARDPEIYYSVGIEVPPKRGSVFSMRYTEVPSARAGRRLLRQKMLRKKVGMIGEVIIADARGTASISLGGFIRRENKRLEEFDGDINRGALIKKRLQATVDRAR